MELSREVAPIAAESEKAKRSAQSRCFSRLCELVHSTKSFVRVQVIAQRFENPGVDSSVRRRLAVGEGEPVLKFLLRSFQFVNGPVDRLAIMSAKHREA